MWNMPLQLSCPTFYDCGSRPTDADQAALEVQEGDIVVLVSFEISGGLCSCCGDGAVQPATLVCQLRCCIACALV